MGKLLNENRENDILSKTKSALGITGNGQDAAIKVYINNICDYMKNAGVVKKTINDSISDGAIISGVIDTWNLGSGSITLSPFTKERIIQLRQVN